MNLLHPHPLRLWSRWRLATLAGIAFGFTSISTAVAQPPALDQEPNQQRAESLGNLPQDADEEALDYLTRGPLHEAFAEPYEANPTASAVIPEEPPEPIDEVPPEYRPDGENVEWISGYWAWDEQRADFLWVSGVWRDIPPGHRWIPGYWEQVEDGYRWISGFWTSNEVTEVRYLPTPPDSLDKGPSSPQPGEEYFYVPGIWVYQSNQYQWRPGYWARGYQDWVWVPAEYVWTPRGCVYRAGYWDYDVAYRGVVFTPVYYRQPLYRRANYFYRPQYTVDTGPSLLVHLFVHPRHRHYYFGDYYGSRYQDQYYAWATRYRQPDYYDPLYAYYSYRSRGAQTNVLSWVTDRYQYFETNERHRPPHTIQAQREFVRTLSDSGVDTSVLRLAAFGDALSNLASQEGAAGRFRPVDQEFVQRYRGEGNPFRDLVQRRRQAEAGGESDRQDRPGADGEGQPDRDRGERGDRGDRTDRKEPAEGDQQGDRQIPADRPTRGDRDDGDERAERDPTDQERGDQQPSPEQPSDQPRPDDRRPDQPRADGEGPDGQEMDERQRSDRGGFQLPAVDRPRLRPPQADSPDRGTERPGDRNARAGDRADQPEQGTQPAEQDPRQDPSPLRPERTDERRGDGQRGAELRSRPGEQPGSQIRLRPSRPDDWPGMRGQRQRNRQLPARPGVEQESPQPNVGRQIGEPRSRGNRQRPGAAPGAGQVPGAGQAPDAGRVPGAGQAPGAGQVPSAERSERPAGDAPAAGTPAGSPAASPGEPEDKEASEEAEASEKADNG